MNKSLPQITVITVTYNLIKNGRKEFFKQCLESVHNQTYPNIEHLIIDGASTDGTAEILQEYADKGWIKYISEPDKGVCDAMNKGIKLASSEYIAILNSDDYYNINSLEILFNKMSQECADYVFASTHLINKDGSTRGNWLVNEFSTVLFYFFVPFNHETMICKRSVYQALNPDGYYYQYKEYSTAADYEFTSRLLLSNFKFSYLLDKVLNFRMDGNTSPSSPKNMTDVQKKHIQFVFKVYLSIWKNWLSEAELEKYKTFLQHYDRYLTCEEINSKIETVPFMLQMIKYLSERKIKYFKYELLFKHFEEILKYKYITKKDKLTQKKVYYVLGFIPLVSIIEKRSTKRINFLKFLPLLKIKSK